METHTKKTLIVGVVITSAIGLFSWRFYKTYKDLKKRREEEQELLEKEEQEILELMEPEERRIEELSSIHGREAVIEAEEIWKEREENKRMRGHIRDVQISILEEEEENGVFEEENSGIYDNEVYAEVEEEEEQLKHHPDSQAAWDQYVNMRLADLDDPQVEATYRVLFNSGIYLIDDNRDNILESNLINNRIQFFGTESRFVEGMTFAELLLHFAELLDFDLNEGVEFWARRLLENVDFGITKPLGYMQMNSTINEVVNHKWYNKKMDYSFGIFALYSEDDTPESLEMKSFMEQYWQFIDGEVE